MYKTLKARIHPDGRVELAEPLGDLGVVHDALVVVMEPAARTEFHPTTSVAVLPVDPYDHTARTIDRYVLGQRIGSGGMGEVYLASDVGTGRRVVLKRLFNLDASNADELRHEYQALFKLDHPNIVRAHEFIMFDGAPCLVMDWAEGPTLAELMQINRPMFRPLALLMATHLFEALAHAHAHNVLHCDVKPHNTLVTTGPEGPVLKVIDFGMAVVDDYDAWGAVTGMNRIAGTMPYMAHEQFRGELLTPAADVYAAGLVLAELLTGQMCYPQRDPMQVMYAKNDDEDGFVLDEAFDVQLRALVRVHAGRRAQPADGRGRGRGAAPDAA